MRQRLLLLAALLVCGAPSTAWAHTINVCWLVKGNGDLEMYAGTYHSPSEGLSGGIKVDGVRYDFTESFGGDINSLGLTNCQGGFDSGGRIIADPCGS